MLMLVCRIFDNVLMDVAGFLSKYVAEKKSIDEAIQFATALAALTVSSPGGPANHTWSNEDVNDLMNEKVFV